jgi:calcineurin-like phosphoesterase family protein
MAMRVKDSKPVTWLISDPHLFHLAIIRMLERPFYNGLGEPDVRAMNQIIEANWVASVRPTDTIYCLGDFAHRAGDEAELRKLFNRLPGRKILIKGNHDGRATLALPWDEIHDVVHATIDSQKVTLCHYRWADWPGRRRGALMLYGHSHGRQPGNSQSMDIGVDVMGWSPVRMNTIKAVMAELPPAPDPEAGAELDLDGGLSL